MAATWLINTKNKMRAILQRRMDVIEEYSWYYY